MVQGRKYIPTHEDLSAAVEMYQCGATSTQVANFLGVVPQTALKFLRGEGAEIRKSGPVAGAVIHRRGFVAASAMSPGRKPIQKPDNMPAAVKMYKAGASSIVVAKFLGVAPGTAIKMLQRSDVKIRTRGFPTGSVRLQVGSADPDFIADTRPPVTPEYLSILRQRWAEKIPGIVATALQESLQAKRPGERSRHAR